MAIKLQEDLVVEGLVSKTLPNTYFKVKLNDDSGREITAHLSGNMRRFRIKILVGDKVKVEFPQVNSELGRIVYRFK